jgi:HlyD family secretion protein
MTADVEIATATHEKTRAIPIQAVVVRTQRELDRALKKKTDTHAKPGDASAAEEDTVGKKDKEVTGIFVVKNGLATFVPVRTGIASETMIEVFGDVKEGDQVVTGPYKELRELKPGARVKQEAPSRGARKG